MSFIKKGFCISLILILAFTMFGCQSTPQVQDDPNAIVRATKKGLEFNLESFVDGSATVEVSIVNEETNALAALNYPTKYVVFPYVNKGATYRIEVKLNGEEVFTDTVNAKAGEGELYIESTARFDSDTQQVFFDYECSLDSLEKIVLSVFYPDSNIGKIMTKSFLIGAPESGNSFSLYLSHLDSPRENVSLLGALFSQVDLEENLFTHFDCILGLYQELEDGTQVIVSDKRTLNLKNLFFSYQIDYCFGGRFKLSFSRLNDLIEQCGPVTVYVTELDSKKQFAFRCDGSEEMMLSKLKENTKYRVIIYDSYNRLLYQRVHAIEDSFGEIRFECDISYDNKKGEFTFTPTGENYNVLYALYLDLPGFASYNDLFCYTPNMQTFTQLFDGNKPVKISINDIYSTDYNCTLAKYIEDELDYYGLVQMKFRLLPVYTYDYKNMGVSVIEDNEDLPIFTYSK